MIAKDYNSNFFKVKKKIRRIIFCGCSLIYLPPLCSCCSGLCGEILSDFAFLLKLWDITNVAELSRSFIE